MGDTEVLAFEQERVDAAYAIAEHVLEIRDGPTPAANQKDAQAIHKGRQAKLEHLRRLLEDDQRLLVRGRVDFVSGSEAAGDLAGETYYIGMTHLAALADQEPIVVSWEAPIAKAFREPTSYNGGEAVARTRTFEGENRRLRDVRETRFVDGQPEPGSGDPLLEALERRSGGQLHDVVATIQAEQFALMERPLDKTLVIQGGPGTGKTIVGLHRVSVLLFRSDGELSEGDILVVGPSDVFMRYIERVLPELGRSAVTQNSIHGVSSQDVKVRNHDRPAVREIKGREVMAEVVTRHLDARIGWDDEELTIGGVKLTRSEVERLLEPIRQSKDPYNRRRDQLRARLFDALGGDRGGREAPSNARGRGQSVARQAPEEFENALNRLMETRSAREVVHELTSGRVLLNRASEGLLSAEDRAAIMVPSGRLGDRVWTLEDLPLLDEAAAQLEGLPAMGKRYLHIVIDEAQDLSPMQLRMLQRRLSRNGAMTVLGDLAQGTTPGAPSSWEDHLGNGGITVDEVANLRYSYRTTAPLMDFANQLLATIDVDVQPPESVIETGDEPAIVHVEDEAELRKLLVEFVETLLPDTPAGGSVAVIADDPKLREISAALDDAEIDYTWAARSLGQPVTLVPAASANGLEFDHVIVIEPGTLYRSDPVVGPRLLYVALTRARETLTLLHRERLPSVLAPTSEPEDAQQRISDPPATEPTTPSFAAASFEGVPPVAPTLPGTSPPLDWSWFMRLTDGDAIVGVSIEAGVARVEEVPLAGGSGLIVASGYALSDSTTTSWLLRRTDGAVLTIQTGREPAEASQAVLAALDDRGGT